MFIHEVNFPVSVPVYKILIWLVDVCGCTVNTIEDQVGRERYFGLEGERRWDL